MDLSTIDNNNCRSKQVAITICSIVGTIMIAFMLFSSSNMPSSTIRIASATIVTNDTNTATTDVQRIEALLEIVRCNAPFRSNVDLSGCDLFGASFEEADLTNADLSFTDLSFTDLSFTDLSFTDLANATLEEADLTNATLTGTNFLGAVMTDCIGCPQ
jgi:uncharacterized protein YjbI with pentapeptide repeats